MSIYIVRSKSFLATSAVALNSIKFAPSNRQAQVAEVNAIRMNDPVDQEIRRWIQNAEGDGIERITDHETTTPVTGTTLVEMSDEVADRMRHEVEDVIVLRDRPIELIRPQRATLAEAITDINAIDLWHLKAIGLTAARKQGFHGQGDGVSIAVLDTGIDETHPELVGKVSGAYTFDVSTWSANAMDPSVDTDGHGTHVAGLICGANVGVAPGATVLSLVMLPGGNGNLSDFILALEWAAAQPGIPVVNMSAGIPGYLPEMRKVVADLLSVGVLPVFAIGNEGRNRTRSPGNYVEVVSVGATDEENHVASFSSSGTIVADNHQYTVPDLVAPGKGVYSCVMSGGYEAWDGTSMATPIVSGVAALILEQHPDISVPDLIDVIFTTCLDLGFPADRQGLGLVQMNAANETQ